VQGRWIYPIVVTVIREDGSDESWEFETNIVASHITDAITAAINAASLERNEHIQAVRIGKTRPYIALENEKPG